MYPRDNIFNIYYNVGRRTPFLVKRCEQGLARSSSWERMHDPNLDRTFLVEKVTPKGKYGKAYGKCFVNGEPDDSYRQDCYPDIHDNEIPCAGCGEWVLLDVPGVSMDEIFPDHEPDYILEFGKYKGKSIKEVYNTDPKYIFWLIENEDNFHVNFNTLLNIKEDEDFEERINKELERVFPKTKIDDTIGFGKYKGKTFREVYDLDPNYIEWFVRNNRTLELDYESFNQLYKNQ